jgi:acetyl-CoA acetyltransferase family protein
MTRSGREVVLVEAVRTPIARGHKEKGWLRENHPTDLLAALFAALIDRSGVDPGDVGDVVSGCVHQFGVQQYNIARTAWLAHGFPKETPATMVDRACGSGQQAINGIAAAIAAGVYDIGIGAGVEMMSAISFGDAEAVQQQWGRAFTQAFLDRYPFVGQGEGAEMIADDWDLTRHDLDEFSAGSHVKAARATEAGEFEREIVPITGTNGSSRFDVAHDQGIRGDTTVDTLGSLKTVFRSEADGGRITAGSSSQISDGAAAVLLAERATAERNGLRVRARVVDQVAIGVDPVKMLEGPIPATAKILERNHLSINDIDRFECNEAFAPVVLAWERAHKVDPGRVNVRGGAIALGHPVGASGARLMTTLLHILEDQDLERGLVTMCCGGGLGTATLIERV